MLLIGNGKILCPGKIIENGAVFIEDNFISEIGSSDDLKKKYPKVKFIDADGGLIMPGFINCHTHLYSAFARGMKLPGTPPKNFVDILDKLWWKLDKALNEEDVYYSALVSLIECLKSGTTTILDHHASPNYVEGSLGKIEKALKDIPVRAALCYEVSDRDGKDVAEAGIKENIKTIIKHEKNQMIKGMFGLHASFTLSNDTLKKCVEDSAGLRFGFHVHTAEDKADVEDALEKYGMGVVERWNKNSVLGPKTILAHCVHISEAEKDLLAQTKTNVVHNPESNMNNNVGTADVAGMINRGVVVGLGTDGMTADMFQESKVANLVRKNSEADRLLFENNSKIATDLFGKKIGKIEIGAAADIVILDYNPPTPMTADNFAGHFLYGMNSRTVKTTIVNGKVLMENGELAGIDEEKIVARSRKLAKKLWERT